MVLEPVHQHSKGLPRRQLACGPPYLSFAFWIDSFVSSLSRPPLVLASSLLSHGVRGPLRPRLTIAYILISQLLYGDISKQIKTRLSRLWDFHDINDEEKIYHTELVLLDETGASIHVQIYPSLRNKFKDLLQQGKVYYIDSFSVRYANRTYRPVANPLMISFTKWTTLEECIEIPDNFPSITFSLTPFQDVPSLVEKNHFYVGASPFDHICHLCLFPVAALYLSN
ncbi:Os06g0329200 [Oryza sativa Japonica Group]|uniref:Os06g0329200 protein n=1 Tax=Oryza sativa subsp. japonica TaxID=39947 RepID=C7J483_ORYSJ|nr:Os06g0329200 [Oryza sativa Japonica Group]|eukprot:NP_001174765.1 Os06g0329200 [Oryza sativa Japonica Group]